MATFYACVPPASDKAPANTPTGPAQTAGEEPMGPNGWHCYANDTLLADGRPISAHAVMAVIEGDLAALKALVDPLTTEQAGDLMSIDHWPGGQTLLDVACCVALDNTETIEYLVGKGSDVLGCCPEGQQTCLHAAAGAGKAAAVEFLVRRAGADPLAKDRNGLTPMVWAVGIGHATATAGHVAALEYLLSLRELGCPLDIDAKDGSQRTALGWANVLGHTAVAACLRRHGAQHE